MKFLNNVIFRHYHRLILQPHAHSFEKVNGHIASDLFSCSILGHNDVYPYRKNKAYNLN